MTRGQLPQRAGSLGLTAVPQRTGLPGLNGGGNMARSGLSTITPRDLYKVKGSSTALNNYNTNKPYMALDNELLY